MSNGRAPVSRNASLAERLAHGGWREIIRVAELGPCWEWDGPRNGDGYGYCSIGSRRSRGAHRLSYELHIGPIEAGMVICHRCDNPPCINPDHLFPGTHGDNLADMRAKGRERYIAGDGHPSSKLTDEQVREIRALAASGQSYPTLAARFGVTSSNIGRIVRGQSRRAA